ncbi:trans-sulfuration enzyme family protein [Halomonas nitroreducens]|uniref:PLP-dependent transferase n=1 Tax=Halomonas nitroreducens TaxID=447425 RepID=A0A431V2J6_9GAMM|nr:PLP-dependent aspartate aminotransferase family protein [Halomonas nitroreducens]RTR02986.1 PLP-dependent transferase [Halomonas nitroreducens]
MQSTKEKYGENLQVETLAIHGGEFVDPETQASSPNLVMSSTFVPRELTGFSALDEDESAGYIYTRSGNPTVRQLEEKLCALEGSEDARCFASGIAASHALIMGRLSSGDHAIFPENNYAGTAEFLRDSLPRFGIEVSFADTTSLEAVSAAIRPETKMLWLETPCNPTLQLADIRQLASCAHGKGVRDIVVDSTFATPIGTHPIELGADFVVHSLTKYIGGHGDAMGGVVLGRKADLDALNLEATVHFGGVMSPFNAWLIMRGAATLPIRMRAHQEQAMAVAKWLEKNPAIKRVYYPGLPSHPQHDLACQQMNNFSGMIAFQTHEDGEKIASRMIEKLEHVHFAVSLGHHRSLIYWIGTEDILKSTFRHTGQAEERFHELMGKGVFRLSVGLEHAEDICSDLDRCF